MSESSVAINAFTFRSRDGLMLAGDRAGRLGAPSVVLLHGGGQTRHSWGSAFSELVARGYYVVNLDARGHGDSEWATAPAGYGLSSFAADLEVIVESLPNPPVLVGASMGGLTALIGIGSNPAMASALVLVDVVPRVEKGGAERILNFMSANPDGFANVEEAAATVAAYNPNRPPSKNPDGLLRNLRSSPDGRLRWHWDPQLVAKFGIDGTHDPDESLKHCRSFSRPAMLVRGMHSDVVSEPGIAELRRSLPQLEVFEVAAAGHMIAGDKNDLFNRAVLNFLERHRPA